MCCNLSAHIVLGSAVTNGASLCRTVSEDLVLGRTPAQLAVFYCVWLLCGSWALSCYPGVQLSSQCHVHEGTLRWGASCVHACAHPSCSTMKQPMLRHQEASAAVHVQERSLKGVKGRTWKETYVQLPSPHASILTAVDRRRSPTSDKIGACF